MGGGPEKVTQTTAPPAYAQPYLERLAKEANAAYGGGKLGQVASVDPEQRKAQEAMLSYIYGPQAQQVTGGAQQALGQLLTATDIGNNPALIPYIEAQNKLLTQAYQEQLLPAITGESVLTGGVGGSRQGVAQGLAAGRTAQAIGTSTAQQLSDAYRAGLQAQAQGLALAPTIQQLPLSLYGVGQAIGDVRQAQTQAELGTEERALQSYGDLLTRAAGSYGTATAPGATTNPITSALGGAASGAYIGSQIGAVGGPMGAGIGAILGLLAGL